MGRVAEGSRRNYQTIRLGIRNLFCRLRIIIGLGRTDTSCRLGKAHTV